MLRKPERPEAAQPWSVNCERRAVPSDLRQPHEILWCLERQQRAHLCLGTVKTVLARSPWVRRQMEPRVFQVRTWGDGWVSARAQSSSLSSQL